MTTLPRRARLIGIKPPRAKVGDDAVLAQLDAEMCEHLEANGIDVPNIKYLKNGLRRISRSLPRQMEPKKIFGVAALLEGIALSPRSGNFTRIVSGLAGAGLTAIAIDAIAIGEIEKEEGVQLKIGEPNNSGLIAPQDLLGPTIALTGMALFGDAVGLDAKRRAIAGFGAAISGGAYIAGSAMEAVEGGALEVARIDKEF